MAEDGRGKMAEGGSIADRALELQLVCRIELAGEWEGHGIGGGTWQKREKEDGRGKMTEGRRQREDQREVLSATMWMLGMKETNFLKKLEG
jgi:hypothetical protein